MRPLEEFVTPTQDQLFSMLRDMFKGRATVSKKKYILVKGEAPTMLVAHLDTVHKEPVKHICKTENGNILMSPQGIGGDDRCGVYALNAVYEQSPVKPWLLFTCDEEIGGHGAEAFCDMHKRKKLPKALGKLKMIIEIDRKGKNDAVYYDCENIEFEDYVTSKGFKTDWGTFSDISYIAPELGIAAVNLSSGYHNAHTQHEYINRKGLNATVKKVVEMVADSVKPDFPTYEYVESTRFSHYGYGSAFGRGAYSGRWDIPVTKSKKTEPKLIIPGETEDEEEDIDSFLLKIPKDIRAEYEMLLDFYTVEELEELRSEQGDRVIPMLAESEFGEDYYGMMGVYDYEEVAQG